MSSPNSSANAPLIHFEEGDDHIIDDDRCLPYRLVGNLGSGHCGIVEKVEDVNTGRVFARKKLWIRGQKAKAETERIFRNETAIIRGLERHHHIIRVFATYVSRHEVGLILQPVADGGDLEHFLDSVLELRSTNTSNPGLAFSIAVLHKAFGCLASGLAFMHLKKIRHKDIKPQNILIHQGSVLYTDFGYSLDWNNFVNSTTEGSPHSLTRRYSAPEVLEHEKRNSLSDVFSLGCVFVEILSAIEDAPRLSPDKESFSSSIESIHKDLKALTISPTISFLTNLITLMTARHRIHRPKAKEISEHILHNPALCCSQCYEDAAMNKDFAMGSTYTTDRLKARVANMNQLGSISPQLGSEGDVHTTSPTKSDSFALPSSPIGHEQLGLQIGTSTQLLIPEYREWIGAERRRFFVVGRVFAVLDIHITVEGPTTDDASSSMQRYHGPAYTTVRRYVAVKKGPNTIDVCPISTYSNRGTLAPNCISSEHAIIHLQGTEPMYLPGERERGLTKEPIVIERSDSNVSLRPESRICFSRTRRMGFDIKAKDIGIVVLEHRSMLQHHWQEEQDGIGRDL
ncbi:kinase-like domain-containing protein [Pyrenochaeta sp. MPI-SDFR-AT-0127]|nr:kinase-like domain-containing protein [Pyrenochaeta sp. MPI-SDFR-AT-0127]